MLTHVPNVVIVTVYGLIPLSRTLKPGLAASEAPVRTNVAMIQFMLYPPSTFLLLPLYLRRHMCSLVMWISGSSEPSISAVSGTAP